MNKILFSVATTIAVVGGTAVAASTTNMVTQVTTTTYKPGTPNYMAYPGSPDEVGQSTSKNGTHTSQNTTRTASAEAGSKNKQSASQAHTAIAWPTLPAGWRWISLSLHKGPITQVWAPIPGTWYNKPQYTPAGPSHGIVVWGNHVITSQGARFGYGIMMTTKNGTPSQIARELTHNAASPETATSITLSGGQTALSLGNDYSSVSGNTGPAILIANGASSIWINLRVPANQSSLIPVIEHDLRFN